MKTEFFCLPGLLGDPLVHPEGPAREQDFNDLAWFDEHPEFAGLIRVPTPEEIFNCEFWGEELSLVKVRPAGDRLLLKTGVYPHARIYLIRGGILDASEVAEKLATLGAPGGIRKVVYLPDQFGLVGGHLDMGPEPREVAA